MENKPLTNLILAIAGLILCSCATTTANLVLPAPESPAVQEMDIEAIQASTVLIDAQSSLNFNDLSLGHGIGTLVESHGEVYLVTHNHWGDVLEDDLATVEFRDAHNRLIQPLFAGVFKDLIVYQDPGTLVLRATPELLAQVRPAQVESAVALEAGAVVQVAYRALPERDSVAVLAAKIVQTSEFEGEPIYEIRCLNGQGLQKGDSGGGVWHEGKLVGNNWAILVDRIVVDTNSQHRPASQPGSNESYTAILPDWVE